MSESDLENDLRRLRPTPLSSGMEAQIAQHIRHTLPLQERSPGWFSALFPKVGWALAGAAVSFAFFAIREAPREVKPLVAKKLPARSVNAAFEPEGSTSEILSAEDRGMVFAARDREPAQLVRYISLERHFYNNPITGARLEIEIPREDLLYVPVATQ